MEPLYDTSIMDHEALIWYGAYNRPETEPDVRKLSEKLNTGEIDYQDWHEKVRAITHEDLEERVENRGRKILGEIWGKVLASEEYKALKTVLTEDIADRIPNEYRYQ